MQVLNIPNTITILRIIAIPVFVTNLIYKYYLMALFVFIIASITDALDGLVARLTKQQTELGRILDPLADKFLLVTSFILFTIYGWIPKWLTITIISRDLIVVIGWILVYIIHHLSINSTRLGKTAIAFQFIIVAYILAKINFKAVFPEIDILIWITAILTIVSGFQYIYKGLFSVNQ